MTVMNTKNRTYSQALEALQTLIQPGEVFEVRILGYDKDGRGYPKVLGGFFNNFESAADVAARHEAHAHGVYFTLNPVKRDLLARCYNKVDIRKDEKAGNTSDKDVTRRTLLPLDCDPVRVAGVSSTDEELEMALQRRDEVVAWLMTHYNFPEPIQAMSGNGAHALWDIELPNDTASAELVSSFLNALSQKFSDDAVTIDTTVFNAARIWKLYGTLARKGSDMPGFRPHRSAEITSVPEFRQVVIREHIEAVAALCVNKNAKATTKPVTPSNNQSRPIIFQNGVPKDFDIEAWMDTHGIEHSEAKEYQGGVKYMLAVCPFNEDHTDRSAIIIKNAEGKLGFNCSHNSCEGNDWKALRGMLEPGCYDRKDTYSNKTVAMQPVITPAAATADGENAEAADADTQAEVLSGWPIEGARLPSGFMYLNDTIQYFTEKQRRKVYSGLIYVDGTGVDLSTKEEVLSVCFTGANGKTSHVTAPRAELCRSRGVLDILGSHGAAVHELNARDVASFLIEYATINHELIARSMHTTRLGLIEDGLITPAGSVGFSEAITYDGDHRVRNTNNLDAERIVFEEAKKWTGAHPFWLARAMALASPFIAKMDLVRNPVIAFIGESNSGKTTSVHSGTSAFGTPNKLPFRVTVTSTLVGFSERVKELNGLPLLLDEVHNHPKPETLIQQIYDFANKDSRSKGKRTGGVTGGESVGGVLFLAGEASFAFEHRGILNRVMFIDVNENPPLGSDAPSSSEIGRTRGPFLDAAWATGSGELGLRVAEEVFKNWSEFVKTCKQAEDGFSMACDPAWRSAFAVAVATLYAAFDVLGVEIPENFLAENVAAWVNLLNNGRDTSDPAMEAWREVLSLFGRGHLTSIAGWEIVDVAGEQVAFKKDGDDFWRIPTRSRPFQALSGGKDIVKRHGRAWVRNGWAIGDTKGNPTHSVTVRGGFNQQSLKVAVKATQQEVL